MSHGSQRERELLEAAAGQISAGLCLMCTTRNAKVRWSETGRRWQLVVVHRPRCWATRSGYCRKRADEFLYGLLELHGLLVAHYGEDDLVVHRKPVFL